MKFLSLRDLRNTPGALWRKLRGGDTVAITSQGRPRALVIGLDPEGLPEAARLLDRLRAQQAASRMRAQARASGSAELDTGTIVAEIRAARRVRRR